MKNMFKISMICGLLLSLAGTVEAVRKYSPGVAERKAITGDFDVEESEQILADVNPEWVNDNINLVTEIRNRQRGRGSITRGRGTGVQPLIERPSSERDYQPPAPTSAQLEKNEENDIRLVNNIQKNLEYFISQLYAAHEWDPWILATKERFFGQYSEIHFHINLNQYNEAYKELINAFNSFISKVEEFELSTDDILKKEIFGSSLSYGLLLLEKLSELVVSAPGQAARLAIVQKLSDWNKKRLVAQLNLDTKKFVEKLNAYMREFGGVEEGKKSVVDCLLSMSNALDRFMKGRYTKTSGLRAWYYELSKEFSGGLQLFQIPQKDIEKYPNEVKGFIESYNSFISNIWTYESKKSSEKSLLVNAIEDANRCLLNLRELMNINSENNKHTRKIASSLSDWYLFRIENKLNWSSGLKLSEEESGKFTDFAKLAKSFFKD